MLTFQKSIIFLNKNQTLLYFDFKFFSCILKYFTQSLKSEFCKKLVTKSGTECDVLATDKWQNRWKGYLLLAVTQIEDAFVTQSTASSVMPL